MLVGLRLLCRWGCQSGWKTKCLAARAAARGAGTAQAALAAPAVPAGPTAAAPTAVLPPLLLPPLLPVLMLVPRVMRDSDSGIFVYTFYLFP